MSIRAFSTTTTGSPTSSSVPTSTPRSLGRVGLAVVATASALALAACSGQSGQSNESANSATSGAATASTAADNDALAQLQESGVLRIGTEGTYAPFNYHDPATNELIGYDVEVIQAVADKLGVEAEFSEVKWDAIFAGLDSNRYDLIAGQVTVNEERAAKYDLTHVYTVSVPTVVVATGNPSSIKSVEDIAGKVSVHSATSNWRGISDEAGATIETVDGFTEAIAAIRDGRVDMTINDNLAVLDYLNSTDSPGVEVAFQIEDQAVAQSFVLRQNSGLLEAINEALEELRTDGTLAEISVKYFGEDVTTRTNGDVSPLEDGSAIVELPATTTSGSQSAN
ncbi:transporter substrate-binding domain-containing protein [Schaalia vaccimaxillae]|uniref:transporter substrate-binding domain-containing protein n=1 Tax=Schaalia vaccimaxillae TaxID=183916 RepID=UPI0004077323|nr:transporter substrate-binding domain-containing protein [Schaalia vaccimaxillae]